MSAELTADQVRGIAELARLELTDAELAEMTSQLGAILHYVDQLAALDTTGVEPLAHALDVSGVFREDIPTPSLPPEVALAAAPARLLRDGDGFYTVPPVQEREPE